MTQEEIKEKIENEILVECYEDSEVVTGWFYFFQDELQFPFEAAIEIKDRRGKLQLVEVDVLDINMEDGKFSDVPEISFEVSQKDSDIVWNISISKLKSAEKNESAKEALKIWNFWKSR